MSGRLGQTSPAKPVFVGSLLALFSLLALAPVTSTLAAQESGHESRPEHDHRAAETQQDETLLQEPGNTAFAAIREVVTELEKRGDTDWSAVDLEALRQHLRDMQRFTLEAQVVEREHIEGGLRVAVRGAEPGSNKAIRRALHAHAPVLEKETGWSVDVRDRGERTVLRVTGPASDVDKIRGLGYAGLIATGAHHRRHHWMIATGRSPHQN